WLVVKAAARVRAAADERRCPALQRALDEPGYAFELPRMDERADAHAALARIADHEGLGGLEHERTKFRLDGRIHQYARAGETNLTGVVELGSDGARGFGEIGVGEY